MDDMQKLLDILSEINDSIDYTAEKALVDDGLIDSFDVTSLVASLDEAFDMHIPARAVIPENFNSAEAMLAMVKQYRTSK